MMLIQEVILHTEDLLLQEVPHQVGQDLTAALQAHAQLELIQDQRLEVVLHIVALVVLRQEALAVMEGLAVHQEVLQVLNVVQEATLEVVHQIVEATLEEALAAVAVGHLAQVQEVAEAAQEDRDNNIIIDETRLMPKGSFGGFFYEQNGRFLLWNWQQGISF